MTENGANPSAAAAAASTLARAARAPGERLVRWVSSILPTLVVWQIATIGTSRRVAFHSTATIESTRTLSLLLLVTLAALRVVGRRTAIAYGAIAAAGLVIAFAVTGEQVGRAPVLVTFALGFLADVSVFGWPGRRRPGRPGDARLDVAPVASPTGLLSTLAAALTWYQAAPSSIVGVASLVAGAVVVVSSFEVPPVAGVDDRMRRWLVDAIRATSLVGARARRMLARYGVLLREDPTIPRILRRAGLRPAVPRTRRLGVLAVVFSVVVVVALPLYHRQVLGQPAFIFGYTDFPIYLDVLGDLSLVPFRMPPHPAFFVESWILSAVVGGGGWAPILVASANVAMAAVGLVVLGYRWSCGRAGLPILGAVAFAAWFLMAETITVLPVALGWLTTPPDFVVLHTWASPTDTAALGASMLALVLLLDLIESRSDPGVPVPHDALVAAAVIFAGLAKPSFTVPLIPALTAMAIWDRGRGRVPSAKLLGLVVIPNGLLILAQIAIVTRYIPPEYEDAELAISLFETIERIGIGRGGLGFWAGMIVLPLCAWIGGRRYWRDAGVRLALLATGSAIAVMVVFAEVGSRGGDSNLSRPAFFWWMILFILSSRVAALEVLDRWRGREEPGVTWPAWIWVLVPVAVASIASGTVVYLDAVGVADLLPWNDQI